MKTPGRFMPSSVRNNFHLRFLPGDQGEALRTSRYWTDCFSEHPELEDLRQQIATLYAELVPELGPQGAAADAQFVALLYRAYRLLQPYASNDAELFS
jgi:hypothetical protein